MNTRVFIYVQHLLGIGHLKRAALVARACAEAGLDVTLASGGMPVADLELGGARLIQLPPARAADHSFRALLDGDGREVDETWENERRQRLLRAFDEQRPHVVMIEMFPFGRRRFRFELMALLEAAAARRPRPRVVTSLRDILVTKTRAGRNEEIARLVETWFDAVLVHGDPAVVTLERTYPLAPRIADRVVYTGYVTETVPAAGGPGSSGHGEVIVSAGGGAVGERLLGCVLRARRHTRLGGATWRLLAGAKLGEAAFRRLEADAPEGVVVERTRPDFAKLIANCALSISQAGYNTLTLVMAAGARSVVVPFAAGDETEQATRAELLRRRGLLQVVAETDLTPERLAEAVEAAMDGPPASSSGIDLTGAETTARLVAGWARRVAA